MSSHTESRDVIPLVYKNADMKVVSVVMLGIVGVNKGKMKRLYVLMHELIR